MLCVVFLVAREENQIAAETPGKHVHGRLEVIAKKLFRDIGVDTAEPLQNRIEFACFRDPGTGPECSKIDAMEAVAAVDRDDAHTRRDPDKVAARNARITAQP